MTLTILSVGLVAIYRSFFISLNYVDHLNSRLQANLLMDNNLAELQQYFLRKGEVPYQLTIDETNSPFLKMERNRFSYHRDISSVRGSDNILQVDMHVSWRENGRDITLNKSGYIINVGNRK